MQDGYSRKSVEYIFQQKRDFIIVALTGKINSGTSDVCRLLTDKKFCDLVTKMANTSENRMSESRERALCYRYLHHNWRPFIEINVSSVILSFLLETEIDKLKKIKIDENTDIVQCIEEYILGNQFRADVKQRLINIDSIISTEKTSQEYENKIDNFLVEIGTFNKLYEMYKVEKLKYKSIKGFYFYYGVFPSINKYLEMKLRGARKYTVLYQSIGNNIRAYGIAIPDENQEYKVNGMFDIPSRVNNIMKILRHYTYIKNNNESGNNAYNLDEGDGIETNSVYILIDNLKNIFEAIYFRARYSSFYLLAVTCDERFRKDRFDDYMLYKSAEFIENLKSGKKLYKKAQRLIHKHSENNGDSEEKIKNIDIYNNILNTRFNRAEVDFIKDLYSDIGKIRRECYKNNLADFLLQDVIKCVENADLFILRDFRQRDAKCDSEMIWQLGRMVTLMLHPALLTPTKIERCMQMAITAKLNSGCLSRQVGAVVTDKEYNILSLGWNDAPCGAESCIRRNMFDLFRNHDSKAYSEYELHNIKFRRYLYKLDSYFDKVKKENLKGLPYAFCFKDIYQDILGQKDQIYTRALHGEERALAMCGNERSKGGYLFTTSSPCELCAKKIKEAGIRKIYYIERYKGISQEHIINIGRDRAEFVLFTGAIGEAYIKLYTPLISYKDELKAVGYDPVDLHRESSNDIEHVLVDDNIEPDSRQVQQEK